MSKSTLSENEVAHWLENLSDQEFVRFFYSKLSQRHIHKSKADVVDSHLVLANQKRSCAQGDYVGAWEIEIISPAPFRSDLPDAPLAFAGECCGVKTISVGQTTHCPLCSELIHGKQIDL